MSTELDRSIARKIMKVGGVRFFPPYSSKLEYAGEVIEKMYQDYYEMWLFCDKELEEQGLDAWGCKFGWPPPDKDHDYVYGSTAAEAICLAALKAKEWLYLP